MEHVYEWRDDLETVINSRKLSDALGNPSTRRKRFILPNLADYAISHQTRSNFTHF